jgi:hypothetical protein
MTRNPFSAPIVVRKRGISKTGAAFVAMSRSGIFLPKPGKMISIGRGAQNG